MLQFSYQLMWITDLFEDPDAGKERRQEEKGTTEDKIVGWHHQLNRQEFAQTQEDRTGKPGRLPFTGLQSWHSLATEQQQQQ